MSEGGPPIGVPPPGDEATGPPRRPRRRRHSPARPQANAVAVEATEEVAVGPSPVFRPLDAESPQPTGEALAPELLDPAAPEGSQARTSRRPRRRRTPVKSEGSSIVVDSNEPADGLEASEQAAEERREGEAPASRLGRPRRAVAGPVVVNVDIPRGMGRRVNAKLIQQVAMLAVQREGWSLPASLDVLIVSDDEMREINVTRRGIDEATDVLSFPLLELRPEDGLAEDFFVLPPEMQVHLGDVVISFSRVESQADEAGHSRERELAFLTVHGVLHVLGYDHDTEEKRRRMRRREEDVLVELGLRRNGS